MSRTPIAYKTDAPEAKIITTWREVGAILNMEYRTAKRRYKASLSTDMPMPIDLSSGSVLSTDIALKQWVQDMATQINGKIK